MALAMALEQQGQIALGTAGSSAHTQLTQKLLNTMTPIDIRAMSPLGVEHSMVASDAVARGPRWAGPTTWWRQRGTRRQLCLAL